MMDLRREKEQLLGSLKYKGALRTPEIISAFEQVDREHFIPWYRRNCAYWNVPLPTMCKQTISQPYTVAVMTEARQPRRGNRVLEVGAGSGYQAAILAEIVGSGGRVFTMERVKKLAKFARSNIRKAGYQNVAVVEGNGILGYSERAPYDRIIVTAGTRFITFDLLEQLAESGRMVLPFGQALDELEMTLVTKNNGNINMRRTSDGIYGFVPLLSG